MDWPAGGWQTSEMIKVNLLQVKKRKSIQIPFGWIFVGAVAVMMCGLLFLVNQKKLAELEELDGELTKAKKKARRLRQLESTLKTKEKQLAKLRSEKNEYERLLARRSSGWTPTMLLWEDILAACDTVWFRDMRIDSDGRVVVNGISMASKKTKKKYDGIVNLLEQLKSKPTKFKSPTIKRITKTKEKKQDVAQFELNCVLIR